MKIVLIIIAALIVLPFVIALFLPKNYAVESETVIDLPKSKVFEYIKLIKNQDYFNKWVMTDPDMKKTFTGTDGSVGFVYA